LQQPSVIGVTDSSTSVPQFFYTPSVAIFPTCCYQLVSNLTNLEATAEVDKFNGNSMVAQVQWAFQVSQGSVETLFRWGGKRLHHFSANVFKKQCTKFRHHRLIIVRDITKKHFGLFFLDTVYTGWLKKSKLLTQYNSLLFFGATLYILSICMYVKEVMSKYIFILSYLEWQQS